MDNARCLDYEGSCAIECYTIGGKAWLTDDDLHFRWSLIAACVYLRAARRFVAAGGWFGPFRKERKQVRAATCAVLV